MHRPLHQTLIDFAGVAINERREADARIWITEMVIDTPLEVRLRRNQDASSAGWELLADVPQWRWQTGLEEQRGRLRIRWELT